VIAIVLKSAAALAALLWLEKQGHVGLTEYTVLNCKCFRIDINKKTGETKSTEVSRVPCMLDEGLRAALRDCGAESTDALASVVSNIAGAFSPLGEIFSNTAKLESTDVAPFANED